MNQQFWKGLAQMLIGVIVAAFAVQPINWVLLGVTAVSTILIYFGKNIVKFFHSDSPAGALSWINLASGLLIAIGTCIVEGFTTYFIEGVVVWNVVWKIVAAASFTYLGTTFFAPQHNKNAVRGFISPATSRALKRGTMTIILLGIMVIGIKAQPITFDASNTVEGIALADSNQYHGGYVTRAFVESLFNEKKDIYEPRKQSFVARLITPLTSDMVKVKASIVKVRKSNRGIDTLYFNDNGALFLRTALTFQGFQYHYSADEGRFIPDNFARPGYGLVFDHCTAVGDAVFKDYGIGGYVLPPIPGNDIYGYWSFMAAISVYDLGYRWEIFKGINFSVGIGYNANSNLLPKERFYLSPGIKIALPN
jgi:hypothetical protein